MDLDRVRHCWRSSLLIAATLAIIGAPDVYGATPKKMEQGESNMFVTPGLDSKSSKTVQRAVAFCSRRSSEETLRFDKVERMIAMMRTAFACVREGKPLQALATFSEIVGQDPLNDQAFLNRGTLYVRLGLVDEGMRTTARLSSLTGGSEVCTIGGLLLGE